MLSREECIERELYILVDQIGWIRLRITPTDCQLPFSWGKGPRSAAGLGFPGFLTDFMPWSELTVLPD